MVFISHSSKDDTEAIELRTFLREQGWLADEILFGIDCEIADRAEHPAIINLDDGQGGPNDRACIDRQ
jgi:hypothetical protein